MFYGRCVPVPSWLLSRLGVCISWYPCFAICIYGSFSCSCLCLGLAFGQISTPSVCYSQLESWTFLLMLSSVDATAIIPTSFTMLNPVSRPIRFTNIFTRSASLSASRGWAVLIRRKAVTSSKTATSSVIYVWHDDSTACMSPVWRSTAVVLCESKQTA